MERSSQFMDGWVKIDEAPLGKMGFVWHRAWRSPFPGKRISDMGQVWVDTCEMRAAGRADYADWWRPFMSTPERDITQLPNVLEQQVHFTAHDGRPLRSSPRPH